MTQIISDDQIRWFRFRRSGLVRDLSTFATPEDAASALVGIQAQILSAAALSFWNRSANGAATYEQFAARLHDSRSLIKLWAQRHTLHVHATADWPIIQASFSERLNWWERDAKRSGAPGLLEEYQQETARIASILRERGVMGRRDLRGLERALPEPLLSPWGGVFSALVRQGFACHARWDDGEARYAHRLFWLPDFAWTPPPVAEANVLIARRYFHTYGPASVQDFAYWRGDSVRDVRAAMQALAPELTEITTADGERLLILENDFDALNEPPPARERWPVRMLGRFDNLLLGHKRKDWVVPKAFYDRVWRPAGHIEGVVLDNGRAAGTWRYERAGNTKLTVRAFPFKRWPERVLKAVQRESRGVARFFGLPLAEVSIEALPA